MLTWLIVAFWVILAAVAVGAYVERRRGRRRVTVDKPIYGSHHAEHEGRGQLRNHGGPTGG